MPQYSLMGLYYFVCYSDTELRVRDHAESEVKRSEEKTKYLYSLMC